MAVCRRVPSGRTVRVFHAARDFRLRGWARRDHDWSSHVADVDDALLDRARDLDKLYIPTRCPNGLAQAAPTDFYTRPEAERAIADAEAVIAVCRQVLSGA